MIPHDFNTQPIQNVINEFGVIGPSARKKRLELPRKQEEDKNNNNILRIPILEKPQELKKSARQPSPKKPSEETGKRSGYHNFKFREFDRRENVKDRRDRNRDRKRDRFRDRDRDYTKRYCDTSSSEMSSDEYK